MNKSSLKSKALMNEFNNIIRGATTSNEIIIDNNITSERQHIEKIIIIILDLKAHLTITIILIQLLMIILQTKNMKK